MGERPENETSINKKEDTPCEELPSAVEYLSATLTRERERCEAREVPEGHQHLPKERGKQSNRKRKGEHQKRNHATQTKRKEKAKGTSLLFLFSAYFRSFSCCRSSRACNCFRLRTGVVIHALHDFSSELYLLLFFLRGRDCSVVLSSAFHLALFFFGYRLTPLVSSPSTTTTPSSQKLYTCTS